MKTDQTEWYYDELERIDSELFVFHPFLYREHEAEIKKFHLMPLNTKGDKMLFILSVSFFLMQIELEIIRQPRGYYASKAFSKRA